jgi:hypothetical protein
VNLENKKNNCAEKNQSVRLSFDEILLRTKTQIEYQSLREQNAGQAEGQLKEICFIISEIYLFYPDDRIKIAGELLPAHAVQEIFGQLTAEHIEMVLNNFSRQTHLIKNKKAYLRTALYNSVFEFESDVANTVNHILHS